jgi:hypothetical protein
MQCNCLKYNYLIFRTPHIIFLDTVIDFQKYFGLTNILIKIEP